MGSKMLKRNKNSLAIDKLYDESSNFIIIGLTGRTGSGCSTSAEILTQNEMNLPDTDKSHYQGNESRKYRIVKKYIEKNWQPFVWLQVRVVITRYILTLSFNQLALLISKSANIPLSDITHELGSHKSKYNEMHEEVLAYLRLPETHKTQISKKKEKAYNLYLNVLPKYSDEFRDVLKSVRQDIYVKLYQTVGDNIRTTGFPHGRKFNNEKIFDLVVTINQIIKSIAFIHHKNNRSCHIVIDAIRNPLESIYFQERFANFYLVSVNTSNENRINHLRNSHSYTDSQIKELDQKEYPKELRGYMRFVSQDIQKCIEFSDIHINNPVTSHQKKIVN